MVKNLSAVQETWVQSLGWEGTLEEGMAIHSSFFFFFFLTPVFLPGEFHGQGILAGHRTQDCRSQDTTK